MCLLKELANGEGTIRIYAPLLVNNLDQPKQRLEDPSKFVEGPQALTTAFDLTQKNVQIVLSTCCMPEEKQRIWVARAPRCTVTNLAGTNPNISLQVEMKSQIRSPNWNYKCQEGTEARKHTIQLY